MQFITLGNKCDIFNKPVCRRRQIGYTKENRNIELHKKTKFQTNFIRRKNMKLKSKLIATIVSMCAAIAVMGVGVWASTSQNFTVTVKNDVDVKILNVNADVYGEFAIYSQFAGALEASKTNEYAQLYTNNQAVKNHGYLLYAIGLGGYNDGVQGANDGKFDYNVTDVDTANYGYQKYILQAKDSVYLATSNASLANTRTDVTARDYSKTYNVDSTTHTAQVTFMYTIKQWAMSSASDASNEILGQLKDVSLSKTSTATNGTGLQEKLDGTKNEENKSNAQVRINAYISKSGTDWYKMTFANGASAFSLDKDNTGADNVYYIILTFTFGRNNANLDLSLLDDALNHTLELKSEKAESDTTTYTSYKTGIAVDANKVRLASATARTTDGADNYVISGTAYSTNWAKDVAAISGSNTQSFLKNVFAKADGVETTDDTHMPKGYLYVAAAGEANTSLKPDDTTWSWLNDLNNGRRSSTSFKDGFATS